MTNISRPVPLAGFAAIFLLAGLLGGTGSGFDAGIAGYAAEFRAAAPDFTRFSASFTEIGGAAITLGISAIAALTLLTRRRLGAALLLAGVVLGERFLVEGLKEWVGRPRPVLEPLLHMPQNLAYPSGHAANSMTAFLAVALIAVPAPWRWATAVAALILTFLIGCSRIYLGMHWPSDVIGGWSLGLLCVGLAVKVGQRSGTLLLEPQHDIVGRHRLPPR